MPDPTTLKPGMRVRDGEAYSGRVRVISGIVRGDPVIIGSCDGGALPLRQNIFSLPIPPASTLRANVADTPGRTWFTATTLMRRGEGERVIMADSEQAVILPGWSPTP